MDALVVGGGIQGLVALRALTEAGYGCLLVTSDDLGVGQTLHSHGLLDSGTGLMTGETQREIDDHVLPELQRLGVPVVEPASYLARPETALEHLTPVWASHGHRPRLVQNGGGVAGLRLPAPVHRVVAHHVDKSVLVRALAADLLDRVVRGGVLAGERTWTVVLPGAERVKLTPRAVVVAAGCGTRRLLLDTLQVASPLLGRLGHVRTHMLCLRAPAGVLPPVGTVVTPGLVFVAHHGADGSSRWYVTPATGQPQRVDEVPNDAEADVDFELVGVGVEQLRRLVPVLAERDPRVEATVFAGYKQDVDGQMTRRLVDVVATDPLMLVAVPSIFAGAWANAREVVNHLRALGPPQAASLSLPASTSPVGVGRENELRDGVTWVSWRDFA